MFSKIFIFIFFNIIISKDMDQIQIENLEDSQQILLLRI